MFLESLMRLRFGDVVLDTSARRVTRDNVELSLTPKSLRLLELLALASPAAVSREVLMEQIWPQTFVEPGNLHNLVSEVRHVIAADVVRTVHRFGYAVNGEVVREAAAPFRLVAGSETIALPIGETIIGRDVLDGPDVSRRHARITVAGTAAIIEDLGSKNGTWIGTCRIETSTALKEGDEIMFGRTRAVFSATPEERTVTVTPPVSESRGRERDRSSDRRG